MKSQFLTTQQAAERLGLTPGSLLELRWRDDGLPIFQQGLNVHYRLEDLEAFEQRELRKLLTQALQHDRPLPLIRSIARSLNLAVNTLGVERDAVVFKAVREDLKPAPKLKSPPLAVPIPIQPSVPLSLSISAPDLSLPPNASWYLVHTKSRQEDTAITNLERQNYRCYMPMIHLEKIRRGKSVVVEEPMFPSYVFVQLENSDKGDDSGNGSGKGQSWTPIRSTLGVRDLVRFGGQSPKVDPDLISALLEREQLQQTRPQALFAAGDKVIVIEGAFAGLEAIYQTADAECRSMILLNLLNKPVQMRIEPGRLRKVG
jgi:transcriptional antiterminator RfaH